MTNGGNIKIILPKEPHTVNLYSYSGVLRGQVVIDLILSNCVYFPSFGYCAEISIRLERTKGSANPEKIHLHWNLYDEQDMIVGNGAFITGLLPIGGKTKCVTRTDKLEPGHTYRLEII